jgi:hypothetical protein
MNHEDYDRRINLLYSRQQSLFNEFVNELLEIDDAKARKFMVAMMLEDMDAGDQLCLWAAAMLNGEAAA